MEGQATLIAEPLLRSRPVGTAGSENHDRRLFGCGAIGSVCGRAAADLHEPFPEDRFADDVGMIDHAADERRIQAARQHRLQQHLSGGGGQPDFGPWERLVEALQDGRQANRRCRLHRPDAQQPTAVRGFADGPRRHIGLLQQGLGMAQQHFAGRSQGHPLGGAVKQSSAELAFQVLQPGGDVGLDRIHSVSRARHAAGFRDGDENRQVTQAYHDL